MRSKAAGALEPIWPVIWLASNLAGEYLAGPGAIAQLGERLLCKQEVTGSIPVGSTRAGLVDDREKIEMLERKDPWEKSKRLADLIGRGCA